MATDTEYVLNDASPVFSGYSEISVILTIDGFKISETKIGAGDTMSCNDLVNGKISLAQLYERWNKNKEGTFYNHLTFPRW